ncbi:MAG TPA: hypothetical protein GX509_06300 [Firmicutes bacterium]|nr:hypothetical protein [Bacillota bacterium]HHY98332.1 hypothetical protein [Bacillota bacterium]
MPYRGVLEDIERCVRLGKPRRMPVFACSEEFDVRVCGEVYSRYNSDPDVMATVQKEVIRRFDYDWAWLQVDDCIEFEPLGVGVKGEGNILPATVGYLPATRETLRGLRLPDPERDGRMPVLLEAIRRLKEEFRDTVCVVGRTAAPFSSVTLLYGIEETMGLIFSDPSLLKDTCQFFMELQTEWGKAQIEAGADAIWFGDCNASTHLISPRHYAEFALEPAQAVTEAYKREGAFVFYHASEESIEGLKLMAEVSPSALSVGPGLDIVKAKEAVGSKICLIGNLDPINILERGRPEEVRAETQRILEVARGGGLLFNTGEMVPRATPEENILAMVETIKGWGEGNA